MKRISDRIVSVAAEIRKADLKETSHMGYYQSQFAR
jgi:hypothetical protein